MAERSFTHEVGKLRIGAGQEFRGEGILAVTKALLEWDTIDADQINDIMAGNDPRAPKAGLLTKRSPPGDSGSGGVSPNATAPA